MQGGEAGPMLPEVAPLGQTNHGTCLLYCLEYLLNNEGIHPFHQLEFHCFEVKILL